MTGFPDDHRERRAVLVLSEKEIDTLSRNGETEIFADPDTCVITTREQPGPGQHAFAALIDSGLANSGALLVQSPFDPDTYVDAEDAPEQFALTKHLLFLNFCQLLGASRVSVTQVTAVDGGKSESVGVQAGRLGTNLSANLERSDSEKLKARLSLFDELEGGAPDLAAAERFLRDNRLTGDQTMKSLLQARAARNGVKRRMVTLNLSNETKKTLSVVAKLNIPTVIDGEGTYKRVAKERKTFEIEMEVTFNDDRVEARSDVLPDDGSRPALD